jgi:hypothetical protein
LQARATRSGCIVRVKSHPLGTGPPENRYFPGVHTVSFLSQHKVILGIQWKVGIGPLKLSCRSSRLNDYSEQRGWPSPHAESRGVGFPFESTSISTRNCRAFCPEVCAYLFRQKVINLLRSLSGQNDPRLGDALGN